MKISLPNDHEAELPINNICDSYNDKLQEMIDNNKYDEEVCYHVVCLCRLKFHIKILILNLLSL